MRGVWLVCVVSLVLAWPLELAAQRRADLVEQGISLREQGRDAEALVLFEQAYAQTSSPRALAQIALAEQALGRFVEAEAHLADALAQSTDAFIRRNRAHLEGALEEIRLRVGDLEVVGGRPGAEVILGGVAVGVLPLDAPVRVVAGSVAVEVRAPGFERFIDTVQVRGGGSTTVRAELVPLAGTRVPPREEEREREVAIEEPPATSAPGPTPPSWVLPTGIALAGAGVVGLGLGAGLMVVREDRAQQRLTCSDTDPDCRAAYGAGVDAEAGGIASFVVGGALLAGGGAVLVLGLTGALGSEPSETDDHAVAVRCAPGGLSLVCQGHF
ncbi:MAG: tetratricopeptide repeat protein [Sandaracinaceae bacterium]|nr:tetratricopeptide repeat protein [Sandaracinaceae bacterium]